MTTMLENWGTRDPRWEGISSRTIHVDGRDVPALWIDGRGTPQLLIHGLGGSKTNWLEVMADLSHDGPVLAIDLPGFGRSPLGSHRSAMTAHADLVARCTRAWTDQPVALAGNSMGGLVAVLAASRHRDLADRVTLVASALPRAGTGPIDPTILPAWLSLWLPGATTAVAGRRNRTPPARRVDQLLDLCVAPGADVPADARAEMVDVAAQRDRGDHVRAWGRSARSLWSWLARRGSFHAAVDTLDADGVLLTGAVDPIIPASSATAFMERHPSWTHIDLPGVGHVPPLEAPDRTAGAIVA